MIKILQQVGKSFWLRWKITLLFLAFLSGAQIQGWSQHLASSEFDYDGDLQEKQVSLKTFLKALESPQHKIHFNYLSATIKDKIVNIPDMKGDSLDLVLKKVLSTLSLEFEKVNNTHYVIIEKLNKQRTKLKNLDPKSPDMQEGLNNFNRNMFPERKLMSLVSKEIAELKNKQQLTVSGKVTSQANQPLPGVNVVVKGTSEGTVTDAYGNYNIEVADDATLVFSFVGYLTQQVNVNGRNTINIIMREDISQLEEVVVTAFGIEREKKALSHAVQEVEGERISAVGNTNVVNSLQGKIAGVTVRQSSGAPGSSHDITIRGSRSLLGSNEPLYVVDGMPVSSGSRTIDINPNDVKSINVLKGPTAAALYGLRASNGVIVIETKKGEGISGDQPSISFETNYNFDQISMLPDMQLTYMQGQNGQFNPYSPFSWGPKIDTMGVYINQLGEEEEAAAYDNPGKFYQTGGTLNSNLNIANTFDKGNYAINLGMADQTGIIENSGMQRMNVKVAGGYNLTDNFRVSSSINYANNLVNGIPSGPSSSWWAAFGVPPSYNLAGKPFHKPGNPYQQINFRGQHDNLYWMVKNNYTENKTSRTFGNLNLNYAPIDWLSVNYRLGLDEYINNVKTVLEKGSGPGRTDPPSGGRINNFMRQHRQINSNLNITLNRDLADQFNVELMVGNEFYDIRSRNISNSGNDIVIGGFHHISNTAVQSTSESLSRSRVVGFFGNLSLSWQNSIFLNATGRNDVVSNMPRGNRSFFYPSLGTGIVFTEFLSVPENILTFGKIRASVAEVGQAGPLHSTQTLFVSGSATGGFNWPYQGFNAFTQSNQLNASDLRTENTRTFEVGIDLRFFNDRIGLDYTYYDSKSDGQIYRVPIAISTGFSSELRNAGEMSVKGHEVMLNVTPVQTSDFSWDLTTNFSTYTNKVLSLAEGIEQLELGGFRVKLIAEEGEEFPSLRGFGYARDPESGDVVVDNRATLPSGAPNPTYGMPLRSTEQIILGSAQPDFEFGFINEFSYKSLSLSAQIDWRQGGKVSSGFNRLGKLYGTLSQTENRAEDYIFPGKKGYYEDGEIFVEGDNDITIQRGYNFYRINQDPIREANVYDATYVRLRELKLSYNLPDSWLKNSFLRSVSLYLIGRNLWTKAALPHFDPEMFSNNAGEEYTTYPQTKSFGGGLRINF